MMQPKRAETHVMGQLGEIIDTKCHKLHRVFSSLSEIYELSVNMTQSHGQTINHNLADLSTFENSTTSHGTSNNPAINIPAGIIMQEVTGTIKMMKKTRKECMSECFPRPVRLKNAKMTCNQSPSSISLF